jgi:hypothetical protein
MQLSFFWEAHSAFKRLRRQVTCLRDHGWVGAKSIKKQGRRRNIPSTTLPAPDIEIGSRHPVNYRMTGIPTVMCEAVHKYGK